MPTLPNITGNDHSKNRIKCIGSPWRCDIPATMTLAEAAINVVVAS